jgi:uncharacterized damage-inducible protein DinB
MAISKQIAKHVRDVHFGGNWTVTNLHDTLTDVTWQQAITKVHDFNTIATLLFHVNYFVGVVLEVLKGGPLNGNDKLSFNHPHINNEHDWDAMRNKAWDEAEQFAILIEQLPDSKLDENFVDPKYGTYYRNLAGIIEHMHYHMGQIVIIKKLLQQ